MSIKYMDSRIPVCSEQLSAQILHMLTVELVVAGYIHDGTRCKVPMCPFNALSTYVNVAGQDNDVSVPLRGRPVLKFKMQIRKNANLHLALYSPSIDHSRPLDLISTATRFPGHPTLFNPMQLTPETSASTRA
jgi:hypothetical protein